MRVGIIGSGKIGGAVAKLLARTKHDVALSHSKNPETLRDVVAKLGPNVRATTPEDAAAADVVVVAIPWRSREELPAAQLRGKIVVDTMNHYAPDFSLYDLEGSTSSERVAEVLPGARVVKAMNTLRAEDLATAGRTDLPVDERPALFLAGDDAEAKAVVARLIEEMGFAPVDSGSLREGGRFQQPGSMISARLITGRNARALVARGDGALTDSHPTQMCVVHPSPLVGLAVPRSRSPAGRPTRSAGARNRSVASCRGAR
jgi:8-hydroxy-5-deazaflavin:NADPH oxidoreductase